MERYERLERIEAKGPRDVVTEVDHLCEGLIMRAVQERYPNDHFYAEEIGEVACRGRGEVRAGLDRRSPGWHGQLRQWHPVLLCLDRACGRGSTGRRSRIRPESRRDVRRCRRRTVAAQRRANSRRRQGAARGPRSDSGRRRARDRAQAARCPQEHSGPPVDGLGGADARLRRLRPLRHLRPERRSVGLGRGRRRAHRRAGGRCCLELDGKPWFDLAYPAKKWSCLAASPRHHATMLAMLG